MHDMWKSSDNKAPSRYGLQGIGETGRQSKEYILHQDLFEYLKSWTYVALIVGGIEELAFHAAEMKQCAGTAAS